MQITNPKMLKKLFMISWIVYFISYLGRLNYSASMIQIGITEGYSTSQLGAIVTALFISYGLGQLISGILGDRYSPRKLVLTGLLGCSLCNFFVFLSNSYWHILIAWFINGLSLSLIWAPMLKLLSHHMDKEYLRKCCFNIQTSVALGTFFTYIMCSTLVAFFNWKVVFICSTILLFLVALFWNTMIKSIQKYALEYGIDIQAAAQEAAVTTSSSSANVIYIKSGLLTILIAILIMGFLKDGIMTWVPQYITDTFSANTYFSIFLSALLPLINLSGIYFVKYISAKNNNDDLKSTILLYIISMISLILLVVFDNYNMLLSILLFAIVTSCMLGINTMLIGVLPTYFDKYNKVSTIAGVTNSVTYLGSALCGYGLGVLAENYGWNITSIVLVILCALAILACIISRPLWQKFKATL